ncbi:hypothetical protein ACQP2U_09615 [Nocardia sp. CA-084685]|uniref:hypothetical protein n=1 Tax=Nocardia sp. CA-084685 TaxID=3239970 RepID=UPI003D98B2D4
MNTSILPDSLIVVAIVRRDRLTVPRGLNPTDSTQIERCVGLGTLIASGAFLFDHLVV